MRILIADDEPVSRLRLERLLEKWGYDVTAVADGEAAWQVLAGADAPQLAILDWLMPGRDGVSVCRKVRGRKDVPYVYLILLTTRSEIDNLVEAMSAGADDYLRKPFQPLELEVRLRAGKRIIELQEELIAAREALREQATRDALTGALNRRAILAVFDRELARIERRTACPGFGVLVADLDHFKRVNDTHGHLVGDEVLQETVRRVLHQVRRYDSVGRLGGEEFLILLLDCEHDQFEGAAERIRVIIGERPVDTSAGPLPVTTSLGAVWVPRGRRATSRDILAAADRALYTAKSEGRDRLCFATAETAPAPQRQETSETVRERHGQDQPK